MTAQDEMPAIMNYLEKNADGEVKEWGISHATLEEVFLNVTKHSDFSFHGAAGDDDHIGNSENSDKGGINAVNAHDAFDEPLPVDENEALLRDVSEEVKIYTSFPPYPSSFSIYSSYFCLFLLLFTEFGL